MQYPKTEASTNQVDKWSESDDEDDLITQQYKIGYKNDTYTPQRGPFVILLPPGLKLRPEESAENKDKKKNKRRQHRNKRHGRRGEKDTETEVISGDTLRK